MFEGQPSRTAERVAAERAAHQLLDSPRLFDDPLAIRVISEDQRRELTEHPERHDRSPISRPMRALVVVRSRIAKDEIARRCSEGVDQYVVLGAGLDTFAYRQAFSSLRIFEVDQPSTQRLKQQRRCRRYRSAAIAHLRAVRLSEAVPPRRTSIGRV